MTRPVAPMSLGRRLAAASATVSAWRDASTHRRVLATTLSTAVVIGVVKLAALARDLVIAWLFGTADALDAFLIAFLLPTAVIGIVVGAFASSIIPPFVRLRVERGAAAAHDFARGALGLAGLLLLALSALLYALGPSLLPLIAGSFPPEKLALTRLLLLALIPCILFQGFAAIWGALINTTGRFALVALAPIATPLLTVALLAALADRIGVHALVAGVVLGSAIEAALLAPLVIRHKLPLLPRWPRIDAELARAMRQFAPLVAGAALMSGTLVVDQAMATMLGSGSVAALNYGNKLVALVLGLAALPLGNVTLPYFSEQVAQHKPDEVRRNLGALVRPVLLASIPAALILALASEPIARLAFQRGAFTAADTALVANIQALYVLQIPFYLIGTLGVRLLSALRCNHLMMAIASVNFVLNIVLNLVFMRLIGLPGIALATSVVYASSAAMIYLALGRQLRARAGGAP